PAGGHGRDPGRDHVRHAPRDLRRVLPSPARRGVDGVKMAPGGVRRARVLFPWGVPPFLVGALPPPSVVPPPLKPPSEVLPPPPLVPVKSTLENFTRLFAETSFLTYFRNSVVVSFATVLLTLSVSAAGAYGLTRCAFPGRDKVAGLILMTYMFAPIMIIIPFY